MDAVQATDSLFTALARLQQRPEYPSDEHDDPPPPYSSGESTQPPSLPRSPRSPQPLSAWERNRQLEESRPYAQYDYLASKESGRLLDQCERRSEGRKQTLPLVLRVEFIVNAEKNIRDYWIEQGIWNDGWDGKGVGRCWKHEEEPTVSLEPPEPSNFGWGTHQSTRAPAITAAHREAHQRETAASRPSRQFTYQVMKEREWLEGEPNAGEIDCKQEAYDNIKLEWIVRKIWNPMWIFGPGEKWMHEEPDNVNTERVYADAEAALEARRARRERALEKRKDHARRQREEFERNLSPEEREERARVAREIDDFFSNGGIHPKPRNEVLTLVATPNVDLFRGPHDDESGARSPQVSTLPTLFSGAPFRAPGTFRNSQPTTGKRRTRTEIETEDEVDPPTTTDNQIDASDIEESIRTVREPMRKRKRSEQDTAEEPPKAKKRMKVPPREPLQPEQVCQQRRFSRANLCEDATTTTSRDTKSRLGKTRSRGKAILRTVEKRQTTGETKTQGGESDEVDHPAIRRSSRIQERRGTGRVTVYDSIADTPGPRSRKGEHQRRHKPRERLKRKAP